MPALVAALRAHRWVRPSFAAREVVSAFRRHAGTAVAIVVTATLGLVMLGGSLLVRAQVDDLKGAWYDTTQVAAYLSHDATGSDVHRLGQHLANHELVDRVWFEDQDLAYRNFAKQFADSPELVQEVTAEQLPRSYRIKLVDPGDGQALVDQLTGRPGVRQVVDEHAQLSTLFDVLGGFGTAALVLAVIQALAAVVLISNMVRSSIVVRARELEVGRVMGATRAQLGVPFLAEVITYGLAGTAAAVGMLAVAKSELIDQRLATSGVMPGVIGFIGWDAVWATIPWLLVAGVGLPVVVTAVMLRRHLRV